MAFKDKALQNVVSSLTQLRQGLGPDEREILDYLVLGDTPEVIAHAASHDAVSPGRQLVEFDEEAVAYRMVQS